MFYLFKRNLNEVTGEDVEKTIRANSARRKSSLDVHSSSTFIRQEKYFLAFENQDGISITRIRTPFEKILPKLILYFPKDNFTTYKIRLGLASFLLGALLVFSLLIQILSATKYLSISSEIIDVLIFIIFFFGLALLELKLTLNALRRAINNLSKKG